MRSLALVAALTVAAPGIAVGAPAEGEQSRWFAEPGSVVPAATWTPAKAYGPAFPTLEGPVVNPDGSPTDITVRSWACIAGGTAGTALAAALGAENVMNIIAGGLVAPVSAAALYIGLAGVVFLSYCAISQELTPLVRYYLRTREPAATAPTR